MTSRRTRGRLAPLTLDDRDRRAVRNQRRGRPRFVIKTIVRSVRGHEVVDRFRVPVETASS